MEMMQAVEQMGRQARELGSEQWDILAGESREEGLAILKGRVDNLEVSASRGIGIRLFRDGRPGYAFTERLDEGALRQTVKDAWEQATLTDPLPLQLPGASEPGEGRAVIGLFTPELEELELAELTRLALETERLTLADARIESVPHLGMGRSSSRLWQANSAGFVHEDRRNRLYAGAAALARTDAGAKMGSYSRMGRSLGLLDPAALATLTIERTVELLGAQPVEGGSWPVLLSNRVAPQLFSIFASPFYAEVVQRGTSRLAGKLGEQIAASCLTLRNGPWRTDLPGSSCFDGEGVPTRPFEVIAAGRLELFLQNLESARRAGCEPTGTGSRSYSGRVGTDFTNLVVDPGSASLAELRGRHPRCLEIVKLEGATGCSAVSGEVSIGAQGFLVEHGVRVRPVDRITLAGDWFELLFEIQEVGAEYSDSFSAVKVPDLLLRSMRVSG